MLQEERRPWLKVYGDRIQPRIIQESLPAFLEDAARSYPSHIALTMGEQRISYQELLGLVESFAAALHAAGVRKGDRVGLMLPNCPEYVIGFFGTARAGAAATQINPLYVGRELEHILSNSGTEVAVVHAAMYGKVKDVQPHTPLRLVVCAGEPEGGLRDSDLSFEGFLGSASGPPPEVEIDPVEDLASIQYTGGTTGVSKGAMLTHRNLLGGVQQTIDLLIEDPKQFPENGKVVAVAPLFHIFGMTMVLLFGFRHG